MRLIAFFFLRATRDYDDAVHMFTVFFSRDIRLCLFDDIVIILRH